MITEQFLQDCKVWLVSLEKTQNLSSTLAFSNVLFWSVKCLFVSVVFSRCWIFIFKYQAEESTRVNISLNELFLMVFWDYSSPPVSLPFLWIIFPPGHERNNDHYKQACSHHASLPQSFHFTNTEPVVVPAMTEVKNNHQLLSDGFLLIKKTQEQNHPRLFPESHLHFIFISWNDCQRLFLVKGL